MTDLETEGDVDLNRSVHVCHYKGSGKVALFATAWFRSSTSLCLGRVLPVFCVLRA
jgi:hypothetical protein